MFSEQINKINKPVARLTKETKERAQITNMGNGKGVSVQISWKLKGHWKKTMSNSQPTTVMTQMKWTS